VFDDLLAANQTYQRQFRDSGMTGQAAKGLAVLTCIDTRIDPLAMLGLRTGDAKIIRNAGARVTDDALRSLILATNLLGVTRVCVVQHTDCALFKSSEDQLHAQISDLRGMDTSNWAFLAGTDQVATLRGDLQLIEACPLLPPDLQVGGFVFDVHDGSLVEARTS
jgi:carbonic anhydrase